MRRQGPDGPVELIWRGGETPRGAKRALEIAANVPIDGKVVTHDAIAADVSDLAHGSIVTTDCSFQSGRGFVAKGVVAITPFAAAPVDGHDVLVLAIRTQADAKKFEDAERLFEQLLELPPKGMPLPPVHAALEALGKHVSKQALQRVATFYAAHFAQTGVFPKRVPHALWPPQLLAAYEELADKRASDAGKHDEAIATWRSKIVAKKNSLDLGKTVKLSAANLGDIAFAAPVRKMLLGTALPARVAPNWRATLPKGKQLVERAKGLFTIGKADGPADEQITATLVIDKRGRVHHIVDDGDAKPELVASSLDVLARRLHVVRSYISASQRVVGKGKRNEAFEAAAHDVLERIEPKSMSDYWNPTFWIPES